MENIEKLPVASSCVYTLLDWINNYVAVEITAEEFLSVLNERAEQNRYIPYIFTVQENEITSIRERYVP